MPRFLIGDEQGQVKSLTYHSDPFADGTKYKLTTLSQRGTEEQKISIQRMAVVSPDVGGPKAVVTGCSNGTITLSTFQGEDGETLATTKEWQDSRFKPGTSYIGLAASENKIYSCSTNGALQLTTILDPTFETMPTHQRSSLPMRLRDWKLSPNAETFAYGGDEVELSVWNTEAAFQVRTEDLNKSAAASKKRKQNNELFPGEIWRAKNVANDSLGLRQPIRITSIDYLSTSPSAYHIVTGTQLGDVRRYDTRATRRPVTDWKGIGKAGGVQVVKKGFAEHELLVSDQGTSLFSVDLRNGRVIYGYKGLSGAVTSIAPSPSVVASTANDRFARLHSTYPPPAKEGQNLDRKGSVLEKVYLTSTPTVVVWDDTADETKETTSSTEEQDDEVWHAMEQVDESDMENAAGKSKRPRLS
ncbi:hypothetical protein D9756_001616 [Leucocoprinus leucothites]|uniref:Ribosome biogenesis protein NSA1 n=1 Tax=Leucocoprinus leucothites TaxID=201217 RepID=A0A8H5G3Q9_9AGAR|nr:hypothetical protein D9756_001616 [Leucoagaricus leucothites]